MISKSILTYIITSALSFLLIYGCYQFYINTNVYFHPPANLSDSQFYGTLYFVSGFTLLGILFAIIHFNSAIWNWNDANFFDLRTIKRFEVLGAVLLLLGTTQFVMEFGTINMPFRAILPDGFIGMGVTGSALLFSVGLLFSYLASTLTIAKRLKDENDLTI